MINESSGENISFDKTVEKKKIDLLETRNKLMDQIKTGRTIRSFDSK